MHQVRIIQGFDERFVFLIYYDPNGIGFDGKRYKSEKRCLAACERYARKQGIKGTYVYEKDKNQITFVV